MPDHPSENALREALTEDGKFWYVCMLGGDNKHATSTEILLDCLWHGAVCDFWHMVVEPSAVAAHIGRSGGSDV